MNVSDLISQINKENENIISNNRDTINSLWSTVSDKVLSDLKNKASSIQENNIIVTDVSVEYKEDCDIYPTMSKIVELISPIPSDVGLPVSISRVIHVPPVGSKNGNVELIEVTLSLPDSTKY